MTVIPLENLLCPHCRRQFETPRSLGAHKGWCQGRNYRENGYECPKCGKILITPQGLAGHLLFCSKSKEEKELFLKARDVNRILALRKSLENKTRTDKEKENSSAAMKQVWGRPGYKDKMIKMHQLSGNNWHRYTNERGEKYQSKQEIKVAAYLYSRKIAYKPHTRLKLNGKWVCPDFYLPDFNLYLEYFGSLHWDDINQRKGRKERNAEKMKLYTDNDIPFIGLYPQDLGNLDFVFDKLDRDIKLAELPFFTVCGEGTELGLLATFIRSYGCNRRCTYCDTKYSYENNSIDISIRNILDLIYQNSVQRACKRVFLTGGEITIQNNFPYLVETLKRHSFEIMLQTNGTTFLPESFDKLDLLSVDVKGPSSRKLADQSTIEQIYQRYSKMVNPKTQFKYIVADEEDYIYARDNVLKYPNVIHILQPEWTAFQSNRSWLADRLLDDREILANGSEIRLSLQMHKLWNIK